LERGGISAAEVERVAKAVAASRDRARRRAAAIPRIAYPPELPVSERRDDIAEAIRKNPVIIVCGETGSGKTTQLPKICLGLGRGTRGLIGHTQPRRIAARSVATRIAQEIGTPLGETVGYKVRFADYTRPRGHGEERSSRTEALDRDDLVPRSRPSPGGRGATREALRAFHDNAYIKLMTDGILLAETQSDRRLAAYDTLIIDEAHER